MNGIRCILLAGVLLLVVAGGVTAQDLEPRRWSHMPVGLDYVGVMYAYTDADVVFDPVLGAEDVTLGVHALGAKYIRSFECLSRSARLELIVPYQNAKWEGLLQGEPASVHRIGFADPTLRFAMNLIGAPPLKGREFASYRAAHPVETTVGAGLGVQLPFGEYDGSKLLNPGENRAVFRPSLGVEHTRGRWVSEISGSTSMFTDNDDFWNGKRREQEPYNVLQSHLAYVFRPGLWVGGGVAYGVGGKSRVNGVSKYDTRKNMIWGLTASAPINAATGLKFSYIRSETLTDTGADANTFSIAIAKAW